MDKINKDILLDQKSEVATFSHLFKDILKRTEKISSAAYFVSSFFDREEPIGMSLKMSAIELVSLVHSSDYKKHDSWKKHITLFASRLSSLLYVAFAYGTISENTFVLFKGEINKLIGQVATAGNEIFGKEFSNNKNNPILFDILKPENHPEDIYLSFTKDTITRKKDDDVLKIHKGREMLNVEQNNSYKGQFHQNGSKYPPVMANKHDNERRRVIIDVLKKNRDVTIKDLTVFIKDCSEKTIQRELAVLTAIGLVTKSGERRWTRYSLAGEIRG